MVASSIVEAIAVSEISPNVYESHVNPEKMGNTRDIAYGGFALGVAVNAGCKSVDSKYRLYSAVGHYLGPASVDRKLRCIVKSIRDTRTFATRVITVSQMQSDGKERPCLHMVTDFQVPEAASMLNYSAPPSRKPCELSAAVPMREVREKLHRDGKLSNTQKNMHEKNFNMLERFFDQRHDPEGVLSQVVTGVAKHLPTTQDDLPLTERTSTDWSRTRVPTRNHADCVSAMAFSLDGALSFVPLSHSHLFLQDAGACSSLDFALRFFSNEPKYDEWHVRQIKTVCGAAGRTYTEARLWNARGEMVAIMNQQSILRPLPSKASL